VPTSVESTPDVVPFDDSVELVGVEAAGPRMTDPLRAVPAAGDIPQGNGILLLSGRVIDLATFAARCEG